MVQCRVSEIPPSWVLKMVHSQSVTKMDLGQVSSCWSNFSRLRFYQLVSAKNPSLVNRTGVKGQIRMDHHKMCDQNSTLWPCCILVTCFLCMSWILVEGRLSWQQHTVYPCISHIVTREKANYSVMVYEWLDLHLALITRNHIIYFGLHSKKRTLDQGIFFLFASKCQWNIYFIQCIKTN